MRAATSSPSSVTVTHKAPAAGRLSLRSAHVFACAWRDHIRQRFAHDPVMRAARHPARVSISGIRLSSSKTTLQRRENSSTESASAWRHERPSSVRRAPVINWRTSRCNRVIVVRSSASSGFGGLGIAHLLLHTADEKRHEAQLLRDRIVKLTDKRTGARVAIDLAAPIHQLRGCIALDQGPGHRHPGHPTRKAIFRGKRNVPFAATTPLGIPRCQD